MESPSLRRHFMFGLGSAVGASQPGSAAAATRIAGFNVRDYGAAGDGARLDTSSIQAAIDACARAGGGTVVFPAGTYLSGTIVLKSHVALYLDAGSVLRGSPKLQDYPVQVPAFRSYTDVYTDKSLLYAEDQENIAICGHGLIDGQGAAFRGPYKVRPYLMRCVTCRNVSVHDVAIRDSPMWVQHYLGCEDVHIRGIRVHSLVNSNNDGIDIDCCRRVRISDCTIISGDDAIVLKSSADRPSKDIAISNCVLSTRCNALKLGTESNGGFENIVISNCAIHETRLSGIALEMVDGGVLDGISISNIAMNGVGAPIFIRLGDRGRPFRAGQERPGVGNLRNISIRGVQAAGATQIGCAIAGLADRAIENVALEDIRLTFAGGGTLAGARREIPENREKYPEHSMFGQLPAYAFYCRHVKNLSLRNVRTDFAQPDERPALVCDDVEGLELAGCGLTCRSEAEPAIRLTDVRQAFVHGCRASGSSGAWLRVSGSRSRQISVMGNDLAGVRNAVAAAAEVPADAVFQQGNRGGAA